MTLFQRKFYLLALLIFHILSYKFWHYQFEQVFEEIRLLLSLEGSGEDFFSNPISRAIVETKGGNVSCRRTLVFFVRCAALFCQKKQKPIFSIWENGFIQQQPLYDIYFWLEGFDSWIITSQSWSSSILCCSTSPTRYLYVNNEYLRNLSIFFVIPVLYWFTRKTLFFLLLWIVPVHRKVTIRVYRCSPWYSCSTSNL